MCADWQTAETRSVDSGPLTGQCGRDWDWDWTGLGWHVSAATSREARCVCNVQVELGGWSIGRRRAKRSGQWVVAAASGRWTEQWQRQWQWQWQQQQQQQQQGESFFFALLCSSSRDETHGKSDCAGRILTTSYLVLR